MTEPGELSILMERIRQGDESAATELVRKYEPEVRRFIRFRLTSSSVRRFVDSLDICQSVLARFFRSVDVDEVNVADPRQLKALLLQIAQNRIYDAVAWQHAQKRDARKIAQGGDDALNGLAQSGSGFERLVEMQELASRIYSHCSPADCELIQQRMNGAEWSELAQTCGSTEEAVRKRVHRALEKAAQAAGILHNRD
ncbi:RNA polymerase sigma factor [Planctomicrobium sp. SH664]|uniref:RNA polymerase sigma factor n=1 Tax=Planctomicrobium sp. SH664 TaxID=3448125 RepID=UPI003F5C202E